MDYFLLTIALQFPLQRSCRSTDNPLHKCKRLEHITNLCLKRSSNMHPAESPSDLKCQATTEPSKIPVFLHTLVKLPDFLSENITIQSILYCMCLCVCKRETERQRKEGWSRDYGLYTGNTTALNGSASHLKRETEPSVWHRICFQEITSPPPDFSTTVHRRRPKKKTGRVNERAAPSFRISACMFFLRRLHRTAVD